MKFFSFIGLALLANSMLANGLALKGSNAPRLNVQGQQQESLSQVDLQDEQPMPYQFNYETQSEGGSSSRSEVADGTGKVLGQYSIKGADGISRTVSYTADSEGFRANISTNEPGTESQNPSFIVLQSSQLPAAEISRQLQNEQDLQSQQEEQPIEEAAAPVSAPPRKSNNAPVKSRRPAQLPQKQSAQVSVPVKSRRPVPQAPQPVSAPPAKRPQQVSNPVKSGAVRRAPVKSLAQPTTQRPRPVAAPAKRPVQQPAPQLQEEALEDPSSPLNQSQEESAEDDSQDGF